MNQNDDKISPQNSADDQRRRAAEGKARTRCEDVQPLVLDFLNKELGAARSDVVREHLKRCPACRIYASEVQSTLAALQKVPGAGEENQKLSDKHRARILRSIAHPILAWLDRHHVLISCIIVLLVAIVVASWLKRVRILREDRSRHITVTIGTGASSGEAPARLDAPREPIKDMEGNNQE